MCLLNKVVALVEDNTKLENDKFNCVILTSFGKMLSGECKFRLPGAYLQRAVKEN